MRGKIGWYIVALFISLLFQFNCSYAEYRTEFEANSGFRIDELNWNIAGNIKGTNPNVLSELIWKKLKSHQVRFRGKLFIVDNLFLYGRMGYGWIYDGTNRDSDYYGDNRSREFSRSENKSKEGYLFDLSFGAGYLIEYTVGTIRLGVSPLAGYSYVEQNLTITDGFQVIPPTGPFQGLDSTYETEWKGPWAGGEVFVEFKGHTLISGFEYHWADFSADANWNLRKDLAHPVSFRHIADGEGVVAFLGWRYGFMQGWSLNLAVDYWDWYTLPGKDYTYFSDGSSSVTRLNEVNWRATTFMAGIVYRFE